MIKVTDEMIEAGQTALCDDGWNETDAGECDLNFVFSAMYEAAGASYKAEQLDKLLESATRQINQRDEVIGNMMKLVMTRGHPPRIWELRHQDLRMLCIENGWCLRCNEYHADGFCDADDWC